MKYELGVKGPRPRVCKVCHEPAEWSIEIIHQNGAATVKLDGRTIVHARLEQSYYCDTHVREVFPA